MKTLLSLLICSLGASVTICRGQYPAFARTIELPSSSQAIIQAATLTSDSGMMFLVNHDSLKAFVKLDVNGDLAWARQYPQVIADNLWSVLSWFPTDDGGAVLFNESWTDMISSNYYARAIVSRIDSDGEIVWSKRIRAETYWGAAHFERLIPMTGGNMFITFSSTPGTSNAQYIMKMDWNGNVLWHRELIAPFGIQNLRAHGTEDGGCVLVGWPGFAGGRFLVSRFDANGTLLWSKTIEMTNASWTYYMGEALTTSTGDTYVTGSQSGPISFQGFMCKISGAGSLVWYKFQNAVGGGDPSPRDWVMELPNGDLGFGMGHGVRIDTSGVNISNSGYSSPPYSLFSNGYGLYPRWSNSVEEQNMLTGNWEVEDATFGYIYYTPVVMRFPKDAAGSCYYDTASFTTPSDTLVPWAFLQVLDEGTSLPRIWDVVDTTVLSIPVTLTLGEFCSLLTISQNGSIAPVITVVPTLARVGDPITVSGSNISRVDVFDATGRIMSHLASMGGEQVMIDTKGMASGAYLVVARGDHGYPLSSQRFLLQ